MEEGEGGAGWVTAMVEAEMAEVEVEEKFKW